MFDSFFWRFKVDSAINWSTAKATIYIMSIITDLMNYLSAILVPIITVQWVRQIPIICSLVLTTFTVVSMLIIMRTKDSNKSKFFTFVFCMAFSLFTFGLSAIIAIYYKDYLGIVPILILFVYNYQQNWYNNFVIYNDTLLEIPLVGTN